MGTSPQGATIGLTPYKNLSATSLLLLATMYPYVTYMYLSFLNHILYFNDKKLVVLCVQTSVYALYNDVSQKFNVKLFFLNTVHYVIC